MKIALVLPRNTCFSPQGATSIDLCAYDYVCHSRYSGSIRVFCPLVDNPFDGLDLCMMPPQRGLARLLQSPYPVRDIQAFVPDVILLEQSIAKGAPLAKRFADTPAVLRRHNYISLKSAGGVGREARRIRAFNSVICVSNRVRQDIIRHSELPQEKVHTVHNGIDTAAWSPIENRDKTIAFAGRLSPEKGIIELAQACGAILQRHAEWSFEFLVSSPEAYPETRDQFCQILSKYDPARIRIRENATHHDVRQSFERAAIVAVPSKRIESFGLTALEAMCGGAALLAPYEGGLAEVTGESEDTSFRLETVSPDAVAGGLNMLIDSPDLRRKLTSAARARAVKCFDIGTTAARIDAVLENAVAGAI